MVLLRPFGGVCDQSSGERCRWYWFVLRRTLERSWRLVTRCASSVALLRVCIVFLRSFGGGREQASRTRCRWYWFVLGCIRERSWHLVTRGGSFMFVLFVCMDLLRPIRWWL